MDLDDYRRQLEADVGAAAPPAGDLADAMATLADRSGPVADRVEAARLVNMRAHERPDTFGLLVDILGDGGDATDVRLAALDGIEVHQFGSSALKEQRAELTVALKRAMEADDPDLRERAIDMLARGRDVDVQRQLIDGLRDRTAAITTPQRSVELLGYDLKADHYDVLKDVVAGHEDAETRREALRLLAADAESEALIETVVRDKDEEAAVRDTGAAALQAVAPEQFEVVAYDIVADDNDYDEIKASVLTKLTQQGSTTSIPAEAAAQLDTIQNERADGEPLKEAARRHIEQQDN
ncbi:MAG: hypothetical protein AAF467_09055 [Actinomycetota bacterium]